MRAVRLTRKLAEMIDGVDLSAAAVGDRLELSAREATVLIAEGWAEPARQPADVRSEARDGSRRLKRRRKKETKSSPP